MQNRSALRRVFSLLLVLSMIASCCSLSLSVGAVKITVNPGEWIALDQTITEGTKTVNVPIKIGANPGIISAQVLIGYDDTYFTLTDVQDGNALGTSTHSDKLNSNPYKLSWENDTVSENLTITDTTVATLTFSVADGTPVGKYSFTVTPVEENTIDYDLKKVVFVGENGTVSVTCVHVFEFDHVEKEASCTETGTDVYICTKCGEEETRETPKISHEYVPAEIAPTCTEFGYTTYTCTHCGDTYDADFLDELGHDYQAVITPPTATEQGYTTHTCTRCGDSYVDSYTDPVAYLVGDVDDSGEVDAIDRMNLARYLAGWGGEYDNINMLAADVDKNGEVDAIDRMNLARYLAGWDGYDTYFN